MAESAIQKPGSSSSQKYYCHRCSASVDISPDLPNLTCPRCESGFIEELTQDLQDEHSHPRTSEAFFRGTNMTRLLPGLLSDPVMDDERTDDDEDDDDDDDDDGNDYGVNAYSFSWPHERRVYRRTRGPRRTPVFSSGESGTRLRFIEHLLRGLVGGNSGRADGSFPFLASVFHGDPRDYVLGADGLDNVITQLLNEWEGSGTPPASEEAINRLQSLTVTQECIDKESQCSICMDNFNLNETVRSLPCQHVYHVNCITTWLRMHNTCPICRQSVLGCSADSQGDVSLPVATDRIDEELYTAMGDTTGSAVTMQSSGSKTEGGTDRMAVEDKIIDIDCLASNTLTATDEQNDTKDHAAYGYLHITSSDQVEVISTSNSSDDCDSDF